MLLEFEKTREKVEKQIREQKLQKEKIDTSMPERTHKIGALHPTAHVIEEAIAILRRNGLRLRRRTRMSRTTSTTS